MSLPYAITQSPRRHSQNRSENMSALERVTDWIVGAAALASGVLAAAVLVLTVAGLVAK
jgi:hypothetical protein